MKKTALQEAILQLDTIIAMWQDNSNEMDFEHTLKVYKSELTKLLKKEKQDLIDAFNAGIDYEYDFANGINPKFDNSIDYYNQTFEQ